MSLQYWKKKIKKRREPTHPVVKEYVMSKIDLIRSIVPITENTKLLDVGCGNGFFTYYFNKICNVYGIDNSKEMLDKNPLSDDKKEVIDAN